MGYFGSKATSGLCQPLIAMRPPHDTYIETHLGGGAIMRRKPAALRNIGIDRDAPALDGFECDYPVELIHGCAHRFLSEYAFVGSELIYSDPPYLRRTRTSKHRYRFRLRGGGPCRAAGASQGRAVSGDGLRVWLGAVRGAPRRVAARGASGDEPRRGSHRVRVDELRPRPAALGRATRGGTSPTASASSARPRAGAGATPRCRWASASRCWGAMMAVEAQRVVPRRWRR